MHTTVQFDKFIQFRILTIYTLDLIFTSKNQIILLLLFFWNMWRTTSKILEVFSLLRCREAPNQLPSKKNNTITILVTVIYFIVFSMCHAACSDSDLHRCMRHYKGVWSSHRNIAVFGIGLRIYRTPTPSLGAGGWSVQSIVSVPSLTIQPAKHH